MITELFFNIIFGVVKFFLNLMPELNTLNEFSGGITKVIQLLTQVTFIIPVNAFVVCLSWLIVLYNTKFVVSMINWLLAKIPGVS